MDLTGVQFPFSVGDAVSAAFSLIASVDQFILLGLAFVIVPAFIGLVVMGFRLVRSKRAAA